MVKMGTAIKVKNKARKGTESEYYYALKLESYNGKFEFWILMTETDLTGNRTIKYTESQVSPDVWNRKAGRIMHIGKANYVRITMPDGLDAILKISESDLTRFRLRLLKNPEDSPRQHLYEDLLD